MTIKTNTQIRQTLKRIGENRIAISRADYKALFYKTDERIERTFQGLDGKSYDGEARGARVVPMTITEAEAWSERRLSEDERRSVFGGDDEDAEPVVIVVKLDGKHNAKLRRAAQERGISVTSMVRDMIDML